MSQKMMHLDLTPTSQRVYIEGVNVTHLVNHLTIAAGPGEITTIQLELQTLGVAIPEALMDVVVMDSHMALRLREMLADAIIALETIMEADPREAATPELREQIDHWKRHQEFPDGEKLGRYIERMRAHDQRRG